MSRVYYSLYDGCAPSSLRSGSVRHACTATCGNWATDDPDDSGDSDDFVKMRMQSWRSSRSHPASWAMPNAWLEGLGFYDIAAVKTGVLPKVP
jgi:hypothetical protein